MHCKSQNSQPHLTARQSAVCSPPSAYITIIAQPALGDLTSILYSLFSFTAVRPGGDLAWIDRVLPCRAVDPDQLPCQGTLGGDGFVDSLCLAANICIL